MIVAQKVSTGPASTAGDPPGATGTLTSRLILVEVIHWASTRGPGVTRRLSDRMVISTPGAWGYGPS